MRLLAGRFVVRALRMGSGYGGVLAIVGRRHRDGGTGCSACDSTAFEPVRFERWVRCVGCRTVFVQRPAKTFGSVIGSAIGDLRTREPHG